jgi:hypothetical protein
MIVPERFAKGLRTLVGHRVPASGGLHLHATAPSGAAA